MGDTHGSIKDSLKLIQYFVREIQEAPRGGHDVKIVFIGDFVDRGLHDLHNLLLIMTFNLKFPENVLLLRGNHEAMDVCSRYGFSNNIYNAAKEDKSIFTPIWEDVIELFSKFPLGYVSTIGQKKILALHGGIPFDPNNFQAHKLEDIEKSLNCYKQENYDMDELSQSILWSDPDPNLQSGVAPTPRTGRPRFSEDAFNQFMAINNYDILIRAHQKWSNGYKLFFNNRLVSLFSTSTYDGRTIGEAKFLEMKPDSIIQKLGDEQLGLGKGILNVDAEFLDQKLTTL